MFRLAGTLVDAAYYRVLSHGHWRYAAAAVQPGLTAGVRAAFLRLMDTAASSSSADVLVALAPHVSARDFNAYGYEWLAGHLGPQWGDQHISLILAGPGVRSRRTSAYPARLVDIAPTVEHLLGAPDGHVDGVVLADALTHPSKSAIERQKSRQAVLAPVVHALRYRSKD